MNFIKTSLIAVGSSLVTSFVFTLYFDSAIADPFKTSLSTNAKVVAYSECLNAAVKISIETDREVHAKCNEVLGLGDLDK